MSTLDHWLADYSSSHRDPRNKRLHWICVPQIVFAVLLALKCLPLGDAWINPASLAGLLALVYYLRLSWRLTIGVAVVFALMMALILPLQAAAGAYTIWIALAIFTEAWIGQFVGHHHEGVRPSFFKDLQFLLIGPLWLMAFAYRRLGLPIQAS